LTTHGSKTHERAYDIKLSGDSSRYAQNQNYKAATFDQYGVFIEWLYRSDPLMSTRDYFDYHHFVWTFEDRYAKIIDGTLKAHKQHKWEWNGHNATGSYSVQSCKCGATMRRVTVRYSNNEKPIDTWHRINSLV
jgi:hypothetical protein